MTKATNLKISSGFGEDVKTEGIDFFIHGEETQCLEVELDPQESVIAEAGTLMFKDQEIEMDTIFGDGSPKSKGMGNKLLGAGKRLLTGESLFITVFTNNSDKKAKVAFGAPTMGRILPINLKKFGGSIVSQKDSFLCASRGVSLGIFFQKKIMTGLFGGEGFIMQKIEGDGWAFIHMGGTIVEKTLTPGEALHVDSGCVAAITSNVKMTTQSSGGVKTWFFGGEGMFLTRLEGPDSGEGIVWIQSLPFTRLAGRIIASLPPMRSDRSS